MCTISIIVPVYNVEKYLSRCIESILNQTFSDFELILVDDCSPDRCGEICDEYAGRDERVKVIHKEERSGAGNARYSGIQAATGRYVGFVDSDDWIETDMYSVLLGLMEGSGSDIACCEYVLEYANHSVVSNASGDECNVTPVQALEYVHRRNGVYQFLWNKLFERNLLRAVFDDDEIIVGEDYKLLVASVQRSSGVAIVRRPLYHYVQRKNSVCNSRYSKGYYRVLENYQEIRDVLCVATPEIADSVRTYCFVEELAILVTMSRGRVYDAKMAHMLAGDIRKGLSAALRTPCVSVTFKACGMLAAIHPRPFVWLMRGYVRLKDRLNVLVD
jgi:glycosyltransferase involved in cell wall biosynthesis